MWSFKLRRCKKGLSPVVATILMLALIIGAVGIVFVYLNPLYNRFVSQDQILSSQENAISLDSTIQDIIRGDVPRSDTIQLFSKNTLTQFDPLNYSYTLSSSSFTNESITLFTGQKGTLSFLLNNPTSSFSTNETEFIKGPNDQSNWIVDLNSSGEYTDIARLTFVSDASSNNDIVNLAYKNSLSVFTSLDPDTNNSAVDVTLTTINLFPATVSSTGSESYSLRLTYNETKETSRTITIPSSSDTSLFFFDESSGENVEILDESVAAGISSPELIINFKVIELNVYGVFI